MAFDFLVCAGIALYILLMFGMRKVRRMRYQVDKEQPPGFSFDELARLRDQGLLSEEEFAKARDSILSRGGRQMTLPSAMPPVVVPPQRPQPRGFEVVQKKPDAPPSPPPAPPKI